jgi:lipopolysaccharide/colanic/teichoic acid biosynthesis glycosyltransferase
VIKRCLDIAIALCGLVIAAPLLGLIGLAVRWQLGRPILFRQQRPGLGGRLFTILKFRTLHDKHGPTGEALSDAERITGFGRFLRSTSLDELPELINVLLGDMSLVGPRPLLPEYLSVYTPEQARRHEVRPGITGWAQVNGRNAITWEAKFKLDLWYVENQSLLLDLRILALTVGRVALRRGIYQEGHVTTERFRGHES